MASGHTNGVWVGLHDMAQEGSPLNYGNAPFPGSHQLWIILTDGDGIYHPIGVTYIRCIMAYVYPGALVCQAVGKVGLLYIRT